MARNLHDKDDHFNSNAIFSREHKNFVLSNMIFELNILTPK